MADFINDNLELASVVISGVATALVLLLSLGTFKSLVTRVTSPSSQGYEIVDGRYEDIDGQASEESQKSYDLWSKWPIGLGTFISFLTLGDAIGLGLVLTSAYNRGHPNVVQNEFITIWVRVGATFLIFLQTLSNAFEKSPSVKFFNCIRITVSVAIVFLEMLAQFFYLRFFLYSENYIMGPNIGLFAGLIITFILHVLVPRRPDMFKNGDLIDGELSSSLWGRYTYAWAYYVMTYARKHKKLEIEEMPKLANFTTTETLQKDFLETRRFKTMWWSMFWHNKYNLLAETLLVGIASVIGFVPQFAMLKLLQYLQLRDAGNGLPIEAWVCVVALGGAMLLTAVIQAANYYISMQRLAIPLRSLLSILVFTKALRRKDVKGVSESEKEKKEGAAADDAVVVNTDSGKNGVDTVVTVSGNSSDSDDGKKDDKKSKDEKKKDSEDEDEDNKTRQGTLNLIGVDSKRLADFLSFCWIFPNSFFKLIVSITFLLYLIGWQALIAGFLAFGCTVPFNIWVSRSYQKVQGELMKLRDQKMAIITEALQGIRQIKFSAIEKNWELKVQAIREKELNAQWRSFLYDTVLISCWIAGPVLLSAVSLAAYAFFHGELTAATAFTTISVLSQIEMTLSVIPELTTDLLEALVSARRIDKFLDSPEQINETTPSEAISFKNATISWPSDDEKPAEDRFTLQNLNISFPPKELSVVSGKTGSGKSLLLAAILGEVDLSAGEIKVPRGPSSEERHDDKANRSNWILDNYMAFVAQIPWIENGSVKDNIIFGLPFDEKRYKTTLRVCALEKDLDILTDGDMTDIGANGINLSGGQKWRISFARAMYSRAGILVLDDIFSAVDAHVGRQLFEDALTGELGKGRTRILVTHHVGLVTPRTKYSVHLSEGTADHADFVSQLKKDGVMQEIINEEGDAGAEHAVDGADGAPLTKINTTRSQADAIIDDGGAKPKDAPKKFTEDEKRETGKIKTEVYKAYFKRSGGLLVWVFIMFVYALTHLMEIARAYWVSIWTRSYGEVDVPNVTLAQYAFVHHAPNTTQEFTTMTAAPWDGQHSTNFYLLCYLGLSFAMIVVGTLKYLVLFSAAIKASRKLFNEVLYTVLRTPLRWLDTTPVGRILNRMTADFNIVDSRIGHTSAFTLYQIIQVLATTALGAIISPFVLLFAAAIIGLSSIVALRYLDGAREVKRLESNAKSPIFEQFGASLAGLATIRAFNKADAYINKMYNRLNTHMASLWYIWLFNRWMSLRLELIGATFSIAIASIIVLNKQIDASLAGFVLTFALEYTASIVWVLRGYANLEMDMNACERVTEYTKLKIEDQEGIEPPAAWPSQGRLEVHNLVAAYATDLPPVLKGLSFTAEKGERVGVVGRTGAGKSSLTLALFRFLDAREGQIYVDNLDVSSIPLEILRSRLAIIPQDPVLFSGTVRSNLDPFDEHTDAELSDALERVHLVSGTAVGSSASTIAGIEQGESSNAPSEAGPQGNVNIFRDLSSKISEGGLNLSQGQRQLLCLARAIISRPKLMVLDEATSAVDMATDELIQRSIREEFEGSTLLVIAHRLSTIADFDKILVMGEGKALEYASPKDLMAIKDGVFKGMVEGSGERDKVTEMILGKK